MLNYKFDVKKLYYMLKKCAFNEKDCARLWEKKSHSGEDSCNKNIMIVQQNIQNFCEKVTTLYIL